MGWTLSSTVFLLVDFLRYLNFYGGFASTYVKYYNFYLFFLNKKKRLIARLKINTYRKPDYKTAQIMC